jgi:tRNA (adenine57-N1/adenine58-N1)-methyltransferase
MGKKEKLLISQGKEQYIEELGKTVRLRKPKVFYVEDSSKDYHSELGIIKAADLKKKDGSVLMTSKGKDLILLTCGFIDRYKRMDRLAQIIPLKDIGHIITETGIGSNSRVMEAGAGSGAVSVFLSGIVKEVVSYEIREDHLEVVKKNLVRFGIKNVNVKLGDIYKECDEKNIDMIVYDLPEPWEALESAKTALKIGGFIVVYNPSMVQIIETVDALRKDGAFDVLKITEIIERNWEVKGRKVRPKTQGIGHSGFMILARRVVK